MSNSIKEVQFEEDTSEAWRKRVDKELKGKSFEDHLHWQSIDKFEINAWQNSRPTPTPTILPPSTPWKIMEPVFETNAEVANKRALSALNSGAEAVWFNKSFLGAAKEVAVKNIDQSIAPVFIRESSIKDSFRGLYLGEEFSPEQNSQQLINGRRLRHRGASVTTEIATMIAQGLTLLRSDVSPNEIVFMTGVGGGFLTEIAKIRALRWMWQSILSNENLAPTDLCIIGINLTNNYTRSDEYTNILRATSSGLAAVLGGVNLLTIEAWNEPWDNSNNFSQRISRNIQTLLKEEGKIDKNLNPADGSYFIEHLTVQIAQSAWGLVQAMEENGIVDYISNGELKEKMAQERKALIDAYQQDQKSLLGINKFQPSEMKDEKAPRYTSFRLLSEPMHLPSILQKLDA